MLAFVGNGTKSGVPEGRTVDLGGEMEAALNGDDSLSSSEEDNSAPVSRSIFHVHEGDSSCSLRSRIEMHVLHSTTRVVKLVSWCKKGGYEL